MSSSLPTSLWISDASLFYVFSQYLSGRATRKFWICFLLTCQNMIDIKIWLTVFAVCWYCQIGSEFLSCCRLKGDKASHLILKEKWIPDSSIPRLRIWKWEIHSSSYFFFKKKRQTSMCVSFLKYLFSCSLKKRHRSMASIYHTVAV